MLIPVLVFGIIGCGKVQDGAPTPISLQGKWETDVEGAVDLVISASQVTLLSKNSTYVGNIALRTSFDGYKGPADSGIIDFTADVDKTFKLEFYWFDKPYDQIGYINAKITASGFQVTEVKYNTYYQNIMLPPKDAEYSIFSED